MKLKFTKMQGAGNDFVMLDGIHQTLMLTPTIVRCLADRHFGIGADQVLVVERPTVAEADFKYRIFNADGEEVEHCGNGARCFFKFVQDLELTNQPHLRVQTQKRVIALTEQSNGEVLVNMGTPLFDLASVSFDADGLDGLDGLGLISRIQGEDRLWPLQIGDKLIWLSLVSMGNPHAVQIVEDIDTASVLTDGPNIESHPRFLMRVNVGFMQILHRGEIRLRVYERGAAETLACGTGACAAVVSGIRRGLLDSSVIVHARGGQLTITWQDSAEVLMAGPAVKVFDGEIEI